MPASASMAGCTKMTYAMVMNVAKPATTSVLTSVLFSLSRKSLSNRLTSLGFRFNMHHHVAQVFYAVAEMGLHHGSYVVTFRHRETALDLYVDVEKT